MGRSRSSNAEATAKAIAGIVVLAALAGGTKGLAERLNAIMAFFVVCLLIAILGAFVVLGLVWWARSRRHGVEPAPSAGFALAPKVAPIQAVDWAAQLRALDWYQFEKLMAHAFQKQGHRVERRGGAKADGGIDLIIEKNVRMGVQCKFWHARDVGVRHVRELVGAMTDHGLKYGLLITLHGFTDDARELAARHRILLMRERDVLDMLLGLDLPYDRELQSLLLKPEKRCPKCDSRMEVRTARKGAYIGQKFWGCSTYPRCSFILPFEDFVAGKNKVSAVAAERLSGP